METRERTRTPTPRGGTTQRSPQRKRKSDVIYTQPKVFQRNKFLLRLATVAAVVLALTLGMSIFFKVKEPIMVAGTEKYSAYDIAQASGIQEGQNLLSLNRAMVAGKIKAKLPYVDTVRVGIKLPDTVNIEITEFEVVYSIQAADSSWWLMSSGGRIVENINIVQADSYTKILGVQIQVPQAGEQAAAYQPEPETEPTVAEEETQPEETAATEITAPAVVPVTVYASEQLDMALSILQSLESYSILGGVDSVDVTDIYDLQLRYEDRYQVYLGDSSQLQKKIRSMKSAIDQLTDYQRGDLDVSFTTFPDKVGYTPFLDE